jgi:hypothetical protein
MKLTKISAAVLSASMLFVATSASAADEAFTTAGSVAMTSDYLYPRYFPNLRCNPALQGSLTVSHESGLYCHGLGLQYCQFSSVGGAGLLPSALLASRAILATTSASFITATRIPPNERQVPNGERQI